MSGLNNKVRKDDIIAMLSRGLMNKSDFYQPQMTHTVVMEGAVWCKTRSTCEQDLYLYRPLVPLVLVIFINIKEKLRNTKKVKTVIHGLDNIHVCTMYVYIIYIYIIPAYIKYCVIDHV